MISTIKKLLPVAIKAPFRNLLDANDKRRFKKELADRPFTLLSGNPYLSYAGIASMGKDGLLHGGKVKLSALSDIYPEISNGYNLLYLVSSAMPRFAEEIVDWAKNKGVKLVWNQNGVAYPGWAGPDYEKMNDSMKRLIHKADYVFYQSAFCKESSDRYLGSIACPWEIAYNYTDADIFQPAQKMVDDDRWELLSAGTHLQEYRVNSVLKTVAELKSRGHRIMLTISGGLDKAVKENDLMKRIDQLGIKNEIALKPPFSREEAPSVFQAAHLLLHTKFNDPCPTVLIEAMSCGIPVVGSGSGGLLEMVTEGSGILVNAPKDWENDHSPDEKAMADAVEVIMNDWKGYSKRARTHATSVFSQRTWLKRHKIVFENLVS